MSADPATLSDQELVLQGKVAGLLIAWVQAVLLRAMSAYETYRRVTREAVDLPYADEYAALASLLFLASAIASYISIRHPDRPRLSERSESLADQCFLAGLIAIAIITLFFAYEVI